MAQASRARRRVLHLPGRQRRRLPHAAGLLIIIVGVILNGLIPQLEAFVDAETGRTFGVSVFGVHVGVEYVVQIALILLAAALSWVTTSKDDRSRNNFEWAPIAEVARLFIGIFVTMIPALAILRAHSKLLRERSSVEVVSQDRIIARQMSEVKNIAEGAGVKMPSFFGYIGWALAFLIPVFIIDTLLFFL